MRIANQNILDKLNSIEFKQYISKMDINTVLVFGSVLTDDFHEYSDVDIAILGKDSLKIKEILDLELYLENLLERSIDVVDLNSDTLDIFIKINILNTGKVIYSSDYNKSVEELIERVHWYYKQNEHYFDCRRRDLIS
ncbi:type VII toxin-antitoxin system MntA family adenylyltransferase antitoxin [Haloimpatiens lingqiaonensis]|uniref:type VII toxin-antitoxin system MntA family adenylyltransferase antitoxin n=1 Tax=Haloimpatiens lingqiaonensis TaxID=1380675 RepID=UPI0010FF1BED|nr:nucleotidyltransferase domain-containing protein [Haloimpatiens lingqiaonensis]